MAHKLLLSVFPGIDMLGMGFENNGFCVVRSPDLITGGNIRNFTPPTGVFDGVFGGPPCQDFSALNRNPTGYGQLMLNEYRRVVATARPAWFLCENVARFPSFEIEGYTQQRFELDLSWFSEFSRCRHFIFGSLSGKLLNPIKKIRRQVSGGAVTGNDTRSFSACCEIQGLPKEFNLPFFSLEGKKKAVANGVPLQMGLYISGLILKDFYNETKKREPHTKNRRCACGCGRIVYGRAKYHNPSCRKRAQRQREKVAKNMAS